MNYELDWLKRWSLYHPHQIAIKDGESGRELNYQGLYQAATQVAYTLKSQYQITLGDRVVLLAQNEIESIILFFALHRLGAALVPINYRLTEREVAHIIEDSQPKLIVTQPMYQHLVTQSQVKIEVIEAGLGLFASDSQTFTDFLASPESMAMLLYTSGTTGAPKGAILSHQMLFWNSVNTSLRLNITQHDAAVIFLPLFHTGGWNVLLTPFLHRGAKVVLLKKFDAQQVLQLSQDENCTLLFGVPTTMSLMAHDPLFDKVSLKHVRYAIVGGEPMSLDHIDIWNRKGVKIRQGYGLTEFGPNVFSLNEEHAESHIGSIGFANFYVQTKVINQAGHICQPGEVGELCLNGPMMMTGYWNNPKATADTIQDGWLYTGDLVKCDNQGFFYVVGRKKDMFISGGENVYPAEIEQVISMLPAVTEVAVIGVKDPKWGEIGKAYIVAKEPLSAEEITQHCLKNLAKFKVPKQIEFRAALPKSDSGKILKRLLTQ